MNEEQQKGPADVRNSFSDLYRIKCNWKKQMGEAAEGRGCDSRWCH
jgi:hypothetical protein